MELTDAFAKAVETSGILVANVKPDQLGSATPCTEFDVKALANHMVGGLLMFDSAARGTSIDMEALTRDFVAAGAADEYDKAASTLGEVLSQDDVLKGKWELPFGSMPGMIAIGIGIIEAVQHGWDLARATGQTVTFDSEITEIAMRTAKMMPVEQARNPRVFGPELPAPQGASLQDELAAFLGRTV